VFVERVDFVSGVGYDRAKALGASARFHEIRRIVTNKAVLDFDTADKSMRLRSVHPGVTADEVQSLTGFALVIPADVPTTPTPTSEQLDIIRRVIDPRGLGKKELAR
jgi:hypothetical protein